MSFLIAAFYCGLVFGFGLLVSGMMSPTKVLDFLDILGLGNGTWDPTLAVVMAAALVVAGVGFAWVRGREPPMFAEKSLWPTRTDIDRPLVAGAVLFGIGWGLVGLCPGPAIANLATLSPQVFVFVIAMAAGMVAHDVWQKARVSAAPRRPAPDAALASSDG
jgi:uncharacterized membrane protein YedE/YeeE